MNDYETHLIDEDLNIFFYEKEFISKNNLPEYCRRCCFDDNSFNCSTKSFLSSENKQQNKDREENINEKIDLVLLRNSLN
jgi:hypothetical protein